MASSFVLHVENNYSDINNHVNSSKHSLGKEMMKSKQRTEMELIEVLNYYDGVEKPNGVTLSNEQHIYVRTALK